MRSIDNDSARFAGDGLDFSDIVLITMSSSAPSGRVKAAGICSCGSIVGPAPRAVYAAAPVPSPAAAPALTFGRRVARLLVGALQKIGAA